MILTIDIGLRNLAMCCMSATDKKDIETYKIHLWDLYNTLDSDDYKCKSVQKSGKVCGKKCSYKYILNDTQIHSCKMHFPKNLNNKSKEHQFKKKSIDNYLLQDIANVVLLRLDEIYNIHNDVFKNITNIFIELQPKINQKMKFTSHIIYGKLVELYRGTNTKIRFVRASQKLKAYTGPKLECKLKGKYAQRKWLSVQYTNWFLQNKFSEEQQNKWVPFFESKTIKADLSDTFLMAINALHGLPTYQTRQKNGKCIK